ncbi:zinc ribbon domain-containing protein [Metallumcola ferriviriculae]|uniref:Zinc ribbon domain-containing protein n=1 Tax=Metallumcola ferriviriculae TaxID=3039180 RepID=A0AAU0UKU3_9FIRM|nr:zinc ribbon domain-containing protein [Desulfitibacteraceae bacterium MK1]
MPIYEYRCPECGVFETKQRITEEAIESCPKCDSPVKRLISKNVGIIYKAGGFYSTDNRPAADKDKAKKESTVSKPTAEKESKSTTEPKSDIASS